MGRPSLVPALVLAASVLGCSWDVGFGGRYGSFDYPRPDARPVEHGFVASAFKLPRREATFGVELGLSATMGGEESDCVTACVGARWFQPHSSGPAGEQVIGPFVGLGLVHVNMRLETWDGSVSGRDQSLGGYVSCGVAKAGEDMSASIELRYTFATELEILGGTMDADSFAVVIGF